jgi:hypothetical protein
MVLFVQLDVPEGADVAVPAGTHVGLFMCPTHNDIPDFCGDGDRPATFWENDTGCFALFVDPPDARLLLGREDPYLQGHELQFEQATEQVDAFDEVLTGEQVFKLGGEPARFNASHKVRCGCGLPMTYLLQIPENLGFAQQASAPEQPDSFSDSEYGLFLGNMVTVLVCSAPCHPRAITVTLDR